MPKKLSIFGVLSLVLAVSSAMLAPASAEFFGCNDKPGKVLASYTGGSGGYTHEFAAQSARPRITIHPRQTYPGRHSVRHCRSWLTKEYRISGPVIVPQMRCWWD